jgi:exosome complex RNA-binding protein Rrp42 (RNase PH superfamily)
LQWSCNEICLIDLTSMINLGAGIDLSSLVLVEGKVCWDLYIDALVVSSDGNLLDSLAAAIKVSPSSPYSEYICSKSNHEF